MNGTTPLYEGDLKLELFAVCWMAFIVFNGYSTAVASQANQAESEPWAVRKTADRYGILKASLGRIPEYRPCPSKLAVASRSP